MTGAKQLCLYFRDFIHIFSSEGGGGLWYEELMGFIIQFYIIIQIQNPELVGEASSHSILFTAQTFR